MSFVLDGAAEETYLQCVAACLRRARLNSYYPTVARLDPHLQALAPATHRGLYGSLELDRRSGLPTYREWTRVQTDYQLAPKILGDLPPPIALNEKARQAPTGIHGKQWLKHGYYTRLVELAPPPIDGMSVKLRRVDPASQTAYFRVIFDKLEGTGLVVRYTVELGQTASIWNRPLLTLEDEQAAHTEEFRSLIFRFAAVDAELTFAHLAAQGLQIERVVRAVLGPFYSGSSENPWTFDADLPPGTSIASFSLDMAATDLRRDRDNDPLAESLSGRLSDQARNEYQQARKRYGFHVFTDRKFVVPSAREDWLRRQCAEQGTRNIIYSLSELP